MRLALSSCLLSLASLAACGDDQSDDGARPFKSPYADAGSLAACSSGTYLVGYRCLMDAGSVSAPPDASAHDAGADASVQP